MDDPPVVQMPKNDDEEFEMEEDEHVPSLKVKRPITKKKTVVKKTTEPKKTKMTSADDRSVKGSTKKKGDIPKKKVLDENKVKEGTSTSSKKKDDVISKPPKGSKSIRDEVEEEEKEEEFEEALDEDMVPKKKAKEKGPEDVEEDEVFEEEVFEEEPERPKVAKKMVVEDGVKRRLLMDSREIKKLQDQLKEMRSEIQGFENEIEYVEKEMEKVRSEKEGIEEEINKKTAIINALEKKLNRTQKDFDGYKGRINQEIERKAVLKMKGMVLGVIEIVDNFDRALSEARKSGDGEAMMKMIDGMDSIRKNHVKLLTDNNIALIEPGQEQFDPNLHEAVDSINDPTKNDNTIVRIDACGYLLEGKVLRPARVVVAKGGPPWPKKRSAEEKRAKGDGKEPDKVDDEIEKEIDELEELEELMESSEG